MLAGMRSVLFLPFTVFAGLLLVACSTKESGKAQPQPSAQPQPTQTAAKIEQARPDDIDPKALTATLKCPGGAFKDACAILKDFDSAVPWNLDTIRSGEARYFGEALIYKSGKPTSSYYFMVAKKVPTNDVSPGEIPVKTALRELDAPSGPESTGAPKLLRALAHDDAAPSNNMTASYVKNYAPSLWEHVTPTQTTSAYIQVPGGAYLRETKSRQIIVVKVEPASAGSILGDGLYARLWPLSW